MRHLSIGKLLQKNPEAKEIFEENVKKIENFPIASCKKTSYGLALPYSGNRPHHKAPPENSTPVAATYQRY
ncbi:MAG: hypothetical protein F4X92_04860 [Gammaproteobacteria bacterium]|nr:hypothetical protein [Gammaproteobacteria bacterium]